MAIPYPPSRFSFPLLAVAGAAFCVWLMVRMINRRERWVTWTLGAMLGVPVLYVASFGPWCWLVSRTTTEARLVKVNRIRSLAAPHCSIRLRA